MRKLLALGWLICVGCGAPELKLEDFLGKYEGSTVMTGPAPVPREGAQTMSVFRALDAAERVRFAEFTALQFGKVVASCPFNGKLADGELVAVPDECAWLPDWNGPLAACGVSLHLLTGGASLLGDELTVRLNGDVRVGGSGAQPACTRAGEGLGRFVLVFNGRRAPE